VTSIIRIPEDGVAAENMSLSADGTRASVIDSGLMCACFDLDDRVQLGDYSPFDRWWCLGDRPCLGLRRVQRDNGALRLWLPLPAIVTLDLATWDRAGVMNYSELGPMVPDVEYSADGSLFAAFGAARAFGSSGKRRTLASEAGLLARPILLDLAVQVPNSSIQLGRSRQFGAVKFSPDGSRLYASRLGPTVVFDTASGEELHQIAGNGTLALSRMAAASRSETARLRCASSTSPGLPHPSLSRYRPFRLRPTSAPTAVSCHRRQCRCRSGERRDR
jgi:hypothetical protein